MSKKSIERWLRVKQKCYEEKIVRKMEGRKYN